MSINYGRRRRRAAVGYSIYETYRGGNQQNACTPLRRFESRGRDARVNYKLSGTQHLDSVKIS